MKKEEFPQQMISVGKDGIKAVLSLVSFEEDGAQIVYCPALDLSTYGDTIEEAQSAFEISLEMYFDYGVKKGTLWEDLKKHGWNVRRKKQKRIKSPSFQDMIDTNETFRRITNRPFTHTVSQTTVPCV